MSHHDRDKCKFENFFNFLIFFQFKKQLPIMTCHMTVFF